MNQQLTDTAISHVVALCEQAAACIRAVNHLTYPDDCGTTLRCPSEAYQALAALGLLTERLPQALRQIAQCFGRQVNASVVVIDRGTRYAGDADRAASDLWTRVVDDATPALHAVAAALDRASETVAHAALTESPAEP
jgi:hypothetical protein